MLSSFKVWLAAASLLGAMAAQAQPLPADAPPGTTVQCGDGSYASPATKSGACKGHKGVKNWYGSANKAAAAGSAAAVETQSSAVSKTGVAPPTGKTSKTPGEPDRLDMPAAPGGGPGKVWVNESSKVYHCQSDRYYGKTKSGEYMSEADAKAKGMRPAGKKSCGG